MRHEVANSGEMSATLTGYIDEAGDTGASDTQGQNLI